MANPDYSKDIEEQNRLIYDLRKDIDHKQKLLSNMATEMDEKNKLLEETLRVMKHSRLERERLTRNENQLKEQVRDLETEKEESNNELQAARKEAIRVSKDIEEQNRLIYDLRKDIDHKNKIMSNMATDMDEKNKLLEASLRVMKHSRLERERLTRNEAQLKEQVRDLETEIEEKKDEMQDLLVKERISNNELQAARKEAIRELKTMLTHPRSTFCIKKMGELNKKPFEEMCSKKCSDKDWEDESAKLCSLWEEKVRDPHWQPFKRIKIDGRLKEVIDEEDEMLKQLRSEGYEKVYESVVTALLELNEFNGSGRYPVLELWNNKEKRTASLKEIVEYIIKQLKTAKPKRK